MYSFQTFTTTAKRMENFISLCIISRRQAIEENYLHTISDIHENFLIIKSQLDQDDPDIKNIESNIASINSKLCVLAGRNSDNPNNPNNPNDSIES